MAAPRCLIFYSWQNDLPNATNRGFIEKALENVAKAIRNDDSIKVEPRIERDTLGVPGAPDIAETIFGKIDQAHIFVGDISIINQGASGPNGIVRPTPNPNVVLELGYALKRLGDKRIILVLNDAYGGPDLLPFDLRARRAICYHMPDESADRATERKRLEGVLAEGLRTILIGLDAPSPDEAVQLVSLAEQARLAIEMGRPDQTEFVREYMAALAQQIIALTPSLAEKEENPWDEQLVQALDASKQMVCEFARLAKQIARMNASGAAQTMYKAFADILSLYTFPPGFSGPRHDDFDHDFAKFLGHELFVSFFSFLLRAERWELVAELLDTDLYARAWDFQPHELVPFFALSEHTLLLERRNQRLNLRAMDLHAKLLMERHTQEETLAELVPMENFIATDYFLFLRTRLQPERVPLSLWPWRPWSTLYMRHLPRYLHEAEQTQYATQLLRPLGVADLETLRIRFKERAHTLASMWTNGIWHDPLRGFDANTLGSR